MVCKLTIEYDEPLGVRGAGVKSARNLFQIRANLGEFRLRRRILEPQDLNEITVDGFWLSKGFKTAFTDGKAWLEGA